VGYRALRHYDGIQTIIINFSHFYYLWNTISLTLIYIAMSHEKAKEQTKHKKEPTKSLKEKRLAKKAKKEEKKRQ
jgi:hypothetical protein